MVDQLNNSDLYDYCDFYISDNVLIGTLTNDVIYDTNDLVVNGFGNTKFLLGVQDDLVPIDGVLTFSPDNQFRIEYLKLICNQVDAGMFSNDANVIDSNVICVSTRSTDFQYKNKNLDV